MFESTVEAVVGDARDVALIGFPNYPNVGDSLMWAGETRWLSASGRRIRYVAHTESFSARTLRARLGADGVVLLHGGGNLGDLWPVHHALRERVVEGCHDRRIVQLPQSIHFRSADALARTARILAAHPRLTVMCRDRPSAEIAREGLGCDTVLCPDGAFSTNIDPPGRPPDHEIVWLKRDDHEAAHGGASPADPVYDWVDESVPRVSAYGAGRTAAHRLGQVARRADASGRVAQPSLLHLFNALVASRVSFGAQVLSRGRVVVTDRLHGHVLCTLLGIPHVVLDTAQGKVRSFHETWTDGLHWVRWADSVESGQEEARRMLRELEGDGAGA